MIETILHKIAVGIVTVAITVASFLGYSPESETPMGTAIPTVVALFETTLAVKITSTATSMTLTSGTTEDGTTLSGFYGFIIDEGTASEEFVTASTTDTVAEDMTRGISAITGNTEIAGLKKAHRRGASVKITNHPVLAVMARIMNGDETFPNTLQYASSPTFSSSTAIVDKNYCDTTFVGLTGNQTIAGLKTFSTIPRTATSTPTVDSEVLTKYTGVMVTGNQTIAGDKTFSGSSIFSGTFDFSTQIPTAPTTTPTTDDQLACKKYVDDVAIAGAPDATTSVKGIVEIATSDEISSASSTGSTGATLAISPDQLAAADFLPIGAITQYAASSTAPTGWMFCDGTAVSRTTYSELFAILGTIYGVGDGSTTFNLPNFQGKVPVGYSSGESEFDAMGETGGEKTHTLTEAEMPAHTHTVPSSSPGAAGEAAVNTIQGTTDSGSTGGDEAHNILQPYITVTYIIRY